MTIFTRVNSEIPRQQRFSFPLWVRLLAVVSLAAGSAITGPSLYAWLRLRPSRRNFHPDSPYQIVGLGDSVMAGIGSWSTTIPALYARTAGIAVGQPVGSLNLARGGLTTSGLIDQLRHDPHVQQAVGQASRVLIIVGANDLLGLWKPWRWQGGARQNPHFDQAAAQMGTNVATALRLIAHIRQRWHRHEPADVVVGTYWNVFTDGRMGHLIGGRKQHQWSLTVTQAANAQIEHAARHAGATVADLHTPFHAPGADPHQLLAADGEHPNAAGTAVITHAFAQVSPPDTLRATPSSAAGEPAASTPTQLSRHAR